jgi:hypothetical protein
LVTLIRLWFVLPGATSRSSSAGTGRTERARYRAGSPAPDSASSMSSATSAGPAVKNCGTILKMRPVCSQTYLSNQDRAAVLHAGAVFGRVRAPSTRCSDHLLPIRVHCKGAGAEPLRRAGSEHEGVL